MNTKTKNCAHCGNTFGRELNCFSRRKMCSAACAHAAKKFTPERSTAAFWSRVDKSGGSDACWPYKGAKLPKKVGGYGWANVAGKLMGAHRHAWLLTYGDIPEDKEVCHTCDNGPCCNPEHLFIGTHSDNMADMNAKGRNGTIGEKNIHNKLTEAQALEILALAWKIGSDTLAKQYGVTSGAVRAIWHGRAWKHLPR